MSAKTHEPLPFISSLREEKNQKILKRLKCNRMTKLGLKHHCRVLFDDAATLLPEKLKLEVRFLYFPLHELLRWLLLLEWLSADFSKHISFTGRNFLGKKGTFIHPWKEHQTSTIIAPSLKLLKDLIFTKDTKGKENILLTVSIS